MSKYEGHTPGPWDTATCDDTKVVYRAQPYSYDGEVVATGLSPGNAFLIADAPLLLRQRDSLLAAALAVLARWTFDDRQQHTHTWHDMADCAELLRTAIADCERNEQ